MEMVAVTRAGQGTLSKLTTSTKNICRRDSLSSSRTRDSGYNSDLDVSFSPLDWVQSYPDQHISFALSVPCDLFDGAPDLRSRHGARRTSVYQQQITSQPIGTSDACLVLNVPSQDHEIENWIKDNLPSRDHPRERLSSIASLSSASSCDMYTNTDESTDEQDNGNKATRPALDASTRKTIAVIMRKIELDLRSAAYTQCHGGGSPTSHGSNTPSSQQNSRQGLQSGTKRKARADDHLSPDDNDQDGTSKRRRGSLPTINSSEIGVMFACPFYKHDPSRYRHRRTCLGPPGWRTVHRVKEHLYRAHVQSIYCPRCYSMFDSDNNLSTHLRSQHCQVSMPQPIEGIDRETLTALRKRKPALRLEEDKWRDVYQLLFPEVPVHDIPSPYYDNDPPSESARRFGRELLRRVEQELINYAEHLPRPVEQQLLRQVAGIVQRVEDDLINSFNSSELSVPAFSDRRESTTSTMSTSSSQVPSHIATPSSLPILNPDSFVALPAPLANAITAHDMWPDHAAQSLRQTQPPVFKTIPWDDNATHTSSGTSWSEWDPNFPSVLDAQLFEDQSNEPYTGYSGASWPP